MTRCVKVEMVAVEPIRIRTQYRSKCAACRLVHLSKCAAVRVAPTVLHCDQLSALQIESGNIDCTAFAMLGNFGANLMISRATDVMRSDLEFGQSTALSPQDTFCAFARPFVQRFRRGAVHDRTLT